MIITEANHGDKPLLHNKAKIWNHNEHDSHKCYQRPALLTGISNASTEFKARASNYINVKLPDLIAHPSLNLINAPMKLGNGKVITSTVLWDVISHPYRNIGQTHVSTRGPAHEIAEGLCVQIFIISNLAK